MAPALARRNLVHADGASATVGDLADAFAREAAALPLAHAPVAIASASPRTLVAAAAWLAETGADGLTVPADRLTADLAGRLLDAGFQIARWDSREVDPPAAPAPPEKGRVSLATSGTTGAPKLVPHSWDSLFTLADARGLPPRNWLLAYQGGTYAWHQMVTLALFVPGQSLTVPASLAPEDALKAASAYGVTAVSATPTFWRLLLLHAGEDALARLPLAQATLGGERADQAILDRLRRACPRARLTHVYASTEAGVAIVVHDGREGFPAAWADGERLRVEDGRLLVRSRHASPALEGWIATGDAVEARGDRLVVVGRADRAVANVGGAKVRLADVERRLLEHPAVLWCRARARRAPLVGEMLAADVVLRGEAGADPEATLRRFAAETLREAEVPRLWTFLPDIPVTDAMKARLD